MLALVQRVSRASVTVDGRVTGSIQRGLLVLLGVLDGDTTDDADFIARKLPALRVFNDPDGKMNLSLSDVGGALLVVSQFTLAADCKKGNRPSFARAARPESAVPLYEGVVSALRAAGVEVATGEFGAAMRVELVNEGPVTVMLDSQGE